MGDLRAPIAIGIDVGGSGIKGAVVEVATGALVGTRIRVPTPHPSTPQACVDTIARMVKRMVREIPVAAAAPVGIGFPSVVIGGHTRSAANVDAGWVDFDADRAFTRALKHDAFFVNDADAAGEAEMRFGAGVGRGGTVILLTLGTGVGSAIYHDGHLLPNTELGHMEIRGRDAERRSAAAARVRRGLSWKAWAEDLDEHLHAINKLFSPDLIIFGGGVSKRTDQFVARLTVPVEIIPATMRNEAGIVGAAIVAAERAGNRGAEVEAAEAALETAEAEVEVEADGPTIEVEAAAIAADEAEVAELEVEAAELEVEAAEVAVALVEAEATDVDVEAAELEAMPDAQAGAVEVDVEAAELEAMADAQTEAVEIEVGATGAALEIEAVADEPEVAEAIAAVAPEAEGVAAEAPGPVAPEAAAEPERAAGAGPAEPEWPESEWRSRPDAEPAVPPVAPRTSPWDLTDEMRAWTPWPLKVARTPGWEREPARAPTAEPEPEPEPDREPTTGI